jgi:hypothetical protein
MTKWLVRFEQNGGEYSAALVIHAKSVKKMGPREVKADGMRIEVDEDIEEVRLLRA